MQVEKLQVDTSTRQIADLTDELRSFCRGKGDGLINVFAPHATAGLALIETGSGSEADLMDALLRLLPRSDETYRHRHGAPGHGADHLIPVFISPSLNLPVQDGHPLLGVWQSLVLVDLNVDNPQRSVILSFLPS